MSGDPVQALPLVHGLSRAIGTRAIYPRQHPRTLEDLEHLAGLVQRVMDARRGDELNLMVIEDELVVEDRPFPTERARMRAFLSAMTRQGVERLRLKPGVGAEECASLVEGLVGETELEDTRHIEIGRLEIGDEQTRKESKKGVSERDLDRCRDAFVAFREDPETHLETLDNVVWRFVDGQAVANRSLLLLRPSLSPLDSLFAHSLNVSLLAIAQARSLGIRDQALHDIGLAALLHDIGKLCLPEALLVKGGSLDEREWEIARLHPQLGAAELCRVPSAPRLAIVVAYEHHWRWDGKPSFPHCASPRMPSLASQLTAIADTYDAMLVEHGLDGGPSGAEAQTIWRARSGGQLDPMLVSHFVLFVADPVA